MTDAEYRQWKANANKTFRADAQLKSLSWNMDNIIARIYNFMCSQKGKLYDAVPDEGEPVHWMLSDEMPQGEAVELLTSLSVIAETGGVVAVHYAGKEGRLVSGWRLKADPGADMHKDEDGPVKAAKLAELGLLQSGETAVIAGI